MTVASTLTTNFTYSIQGKLQLSFFNLFLSALFTFFNTHFKLCYQRVYLRRQRAKTTEKNDIKFNVPLRGPA